MWQAYGNCGFEGAPENAKVKLLPRLADMAVTPTMLGQEGIENCLMHLTPETTHPFTLVRY